jgi:protein SCO1/2
MSGKYNIWIFVAAVLLVPFSVFGVVKWYESNYQSLPIQGPEGHKIANFNLVNQHSRTYTTDNWKGKIVVAHYFFTHCPVICPKMTYNLKRVQAYAGIKNLEINSFSVDPERDSISQLQSYANRFNITGNWQLITGNKKQLYALARKNFLVVATDGDGGPDDFIHSDKLVLIDTKKRIRGFYDGTDEASTNALIKDIQKLSKERQ